MCEHIIGEENGWDSWCTGLFTRKEIEGHFSPLDDSDVELFPYCPLCGEKNNLDGLDYHILGTPYTPNKPAPLPPLTPRNRSGVF